MSGQNWWAVRLASAKLFVRPYDLILRKYTGTYCAVGPYFLI
jgi:hypothetical protein